MREGAGISPGTWRWGRLGFRHGVVGFGAVVAVFGLLLWAKLLLVTGYPRTAIAVPKEGTQKCDSCADVK